MSRQMPPQVMVITVPATIAVRCAACGNAWRQARSATSGDAAELVLAGCAVCRPELPGYEGWYSERERTP